MRKLVIMAVAVLMVLVAAVPAIADQVQVADSGDVVQVYESSSVNYGSAVATDVDQNANTGNVQSQYSFEQIQYSN